ncbi:MAG: insulinase family protein [Acholeplasmatales bacterium]|jgi:hypothetical protein|nr:insulinase family protein [Acholeplasmatales bacterium]
MNKKESIILLNNIKTTKIVYDNGFVIFSNYEPKVSYFTAHFVSKFGGFNDSLVYNQEIIKIYPGTAHMMEHLMYKDTQGKDVMLEIEKLGAYEDNAYTSDKNTIFYFQTRKNKYLLLRKLLEMTFSFNVNDSILENEKQIVLEELAEDEADLESKIDDILYDNMFFYSSIKNTVIGKKEDIIKMTSQYLKNIYNIVYSPSNTYLVLGGNYDLNKCLSVIDDFMDSSVCSFDYLFQDEPLSYVKTSDEYKLKASISLVNVSYKIVSDKFSFLDLTHISLLFELLFSSSSKNYYYCINNNLCSGINLYSEYCHNVTCVIINGSSLNPIKLIDFIKNAVQNTNIYEYEKYFDNMRKGYIGSTIKSALSTPSKYAEFLADMLTEGEETADLLEMLKKISFSEIVRWYKIISSLESCSIYTIID